MEMKSFSRNEIIFRQGDPSDCMYSVEGGRVGIFLDYGGKNETKLTDLCPGQYFGEMGLIDDSPRSASAVALEDATAVAVIREADAKELFRENPTQMLNILEQMCSRLRRVSRDYAEACRTVRDVVDTEKAAQQKRDSLKHRMAKLLAGFDDFRSDAAN